MKYSSKILISGLIATLALWCAFGGYYLFVRATAAETTAVPPFDDPFLLGEYYFNAVDDPSSPYDLKQARKYYEQVIAASSTDNSVVWYQLGRIDFIEGKFDHAIYKFKKQIEYFGSDLQQVHYMLGLTYAYKAQKTKNPADWALAEEQFELFLDFKYASPWARTDLSWIYFAQGKYVEMIPVLAEGLRLEPDNPWLHNMYGLALLNTGETATAEWHFETALRWANELSVEAWGKAYPGNDPALWSTGLESFKQAIEKNLVLAQSAQ